MTMMDTHTDYIIMTDAEELGQRALVSTERLDSFLNNLRRIRSDFPYLNTERFSGVMSRILEGSQPEPETGETPPMIELPVEDIADIAQFYDGGYPVAPVSDFAVIMDAFKQMRPQFVS